MRCPYCNKKIPDGSIECPHCLVGHRELLASAAPIVPRAAGGSRPLAFAVGMILAVLCAFGWAWLVSKWGFMGWPALFIGVISGLTIRLLAGPPTSVNGVLGSICGVVGIGGGLALIYFNWTADFETLTKEADFINFAFIFVGLSLARSLAAGTKRLPKQIEEMFAEQMRPPRT